MAMQANIAIHESKREKHEMYTGKRSVKKWSTTSYKAYFPHILNIHFHQVNVSGRFHSRPGRRTQLENEARDTTSIVPKVATGYIYFGYIISRMIQSS